MRSKISHWFLTVAVLCSALSAVLVGDFSALCGWLCSLVAFGLVWYNQALSEQHFHLLVDEQKKSYNLLLENGRLKHENIQLNEEIRSLNEKIHSYEAMNDEYCK